MGGARGISAAMVVAGIAACSSSATTTTATTAAGTATTSRGAGSVATSASASAGTGSGVTSSSGGTTSTGLASSGGVTSGGAGSATTGSASGSVTGSATGAQNFPASAILYQDVSAASPDPNSDAIIGSLSDAGGWGANGGNFQIDFSLSILHADPSLQPVTFVQSSNFISPDCDTAPMPVPPGGNVEGVSDYNCDATMNDCHLLVYQGQRLYEMYHAFIPSGLSTGTLTADCEVVWDLTHDYWKAGAVPFSRGDQCTSTDAAGMPIAPLLVTGAELQAGVVPHALRFTLPNGRMQAGFYLHPATHAGAPGGGATLPTYGARFRLKSTFDLTRLPNAAARAVAVALQTYGMFLDDGGYIPLTFDSSASALIGSHDLFAIQVSDFDVLPSADPEVPITDNCTRTPITQ